MGCRGRQLIGRNERTSSSYTTEGGQLMSISPQEASAALDSIHEASASVRQHRAHNHAAPFLILWGCIWAVCNTVSQFWPMWSDKVWLVANILGLACTVWLAVNTSIRSHREAVSRAEGREIGRSFAMLGVTMICFFIAMFLVLSPLSGRKTGAFISLFWTLAYMAAGAWIGTRLFITGLVGAIGIVLSYLYAGHYYPLSLAVMGGGTLIAGGLWMRKL
jgi:hypothetical protein